jgi:hypothetical protein
MRRWKANFTTELKKINHEGERCIQTSQGRNVRLAVLNTISELSDCVKDRKFLDQLSDN